VCASSECFSMRQAPPLALVPRLGCMVSHPQL
jgi:hypothetical protein